MIFIYILQPIHCRVHCSQNTLIPITLNSLKAVATAHITGKAVLVKEVEYAVLWFIKQMFRIFF